MNWPAYTVEQAFICLETKKYNFVYKYSRKNIFV